MQDSSHLPLPVMLSQLLVAFTIEHDNEWEMRYWLNADPAPLRTSLVMWANFLRFVSVDGITVEELSRKAGYPARKVHPDLAGMLRWRYVEIDSENRKKPKLHDIVRPTKLGVQSAETWKPLVAEIENRWMKRFGDNNVSTLKQALIAIITTFDRPLPHYFPVLAHRDGMRVLSPDSPECDPPEQLTLPYLLSQAHHLFTLDAEKLSEISLAIRSNVLRVLDVKPIAKKALPQSSGISKEAIAMSITYLKKKGLVLEEPSPTGRGKVVRLTEQGKVEQDRYSEIIDSVERGWQETISAEQYTELRSSLEPFVRYEEGQEPPLFQGLIPPNPNVWRAMRRKRVVLPHHPMVLYRGGWPDGS